MKDFYVCSFEKHTQEKDGSSPVDVGTERMPTCALLGVTSFGMAASLL